MPRLCQEESLKRVNSTPFNEAWDKKFGAVGTMAPTLLSFKTRRAKGEGVEAGRGRIQRPGPAAPPPPSPCFQSPTNPYFQPQIYWDVDSIAFQGLKECYLRLGVAD